MNGSGPHQTHGGLFARPFAWLLFVWALFLTPLVGQALAGGPTWNEFHPALNALLNGSSAFFLGAGFVAIRRGSQTLHTRCMLAATAASAVFLASYLTRFAMTGSHTYPGSGWDRWVYLSILMSHMVLATLLLPLALRILFLARKRDFARHRRLARWTWPLWMYVSVTGVFVYLMLYPLATALYGG